jgi:hypothetical protein
VYPLADREVSRQRGPLPLFDPPLDVSKRRPAITT